MGRTGLEWLPDGIKSNDDFLSGHATRARSIRPRKCARFSFSQRFDYEGLEGRLLSSSYAPEPDHPAYEAMLRDLRVVFDANQEDGQVNFDYETEVYYGRLEKV